MRKLLFAQVAEPGTWGYFARSRQQFSADPPLHTHDFHELSWVVRGSGAMHGPGARMALAAGDLVLVHASDQHGFEDDARTPMLRFNLAVAVSTWEELVHRYGVGEDPMMCPPAQRRRQLDGHAMAMLQLACSDVDAGRRDRLAIERVLTTVLALVRDHAAQATMPEWLAQGCQALADGRWRQGVHGLVAASGRSREHVARVCREVLGKTPTEVVNDLRLRHFATRLEDSDGDIATLAEEIGFTNLTYLYRQFRHRYGLNPGAWRERQRAMGVS